MAQKITKANGHIVQADWNQTNPLEMDYIHNKPDNATEEEDGLMSAEDKAKLEGIEEGAQKNIIEIIKHNGSPLTNTDGTVSISTIGKVQGSGEVFNDVTTNRLSNSQHSHVEGGNNFVYNSAYSHTEGRYNGIGNASMGHVEGTLNTSIHSAAYSGTHVEGRGVVAMGSGAHAEGDGFIKQFTGVVLTKGSKAVTVLSSSSVNYTPGTSIISVVDPINKVSFWSYIVAIDGNIITVKTAPTVSLNSSNALVVISDSLAQGSGAHAEGYRCQALGNGAHAEGIGTFTSMAGGHVSGWYNMGLSNMLEEVGNGAAGYRSNARTLDMNGNAWYAGTVSIGTENLSLATEAYVTATANNLSCEVPFDETTKTLTMESNKEYRANNPVTSLSIQSFVDGIPGVADQWSVIFTTGDTVTVAYPETVKWAIAIPVFEANKTYWLSFIPFGTEYLGTWTVID